MVDCIPQTNECPLRCPECFYNGVRFYRTLDKPLMPLLEDVKDKIVRINSGHDSNINRKQVIEATKQFPFKFYNTSLPNFNFPAPVVFTCNGRKLLLVEKGLENVMFVRVRTSIFDMENVEKAVNFYLKRGVPVVLTFMRYYHVKSIPEEYRKFFTFKKHVLNSYYCHTLEAHLQVLERFKGTGVRMCGTLTSSLCVDCCNCEFLYWKSILDKFSLGIHKQ